MSKQEIQLTLRLTPQEIFTIDNFIFESDELASVVEAFCLEKSLIFSIFGESPEWAKPI